MFVDTHFRTYNRQKLAKAMAPLACLDNPLANSFNVNFIETMITDVFSLAA